YHATRCPAGLRAYDTAAPIDIVDVDRPSGARDRDTGSRFLVDPVAAFRAPKHLDPLRVLRDQYVLPEARDPHVVRELLSPVVLFGRFREHLDENRWGSATPPRARVRCVRSSATRRGHRRPPHRHTSIAGSRVRTSSHPT